MTYPNVGGHRLAARVPITGSLPTAPAPRALSRDWWRAKHRRGMPIKFKYWLSHKRMVLTFAVFNT